MQDFNEYSKNASSQKNLAEMVMELSKKFDGKSQNDLLKAIYKQAEEGKRAGTLSNADLDNFCAFLSPMLDDKKRKMLNKILIELKKI